jgi:hypothetical protein
MLVSLKNSQILMHLILYQTVSLVRPHLVGTGKVSVKKQTMCPKGSEDVKLQYSKSDRLSRFDVFHLGSPENGCEALISAAV